MVRLFTPRSDPALVFPAGRCRAPLFPCQPDEERRPVTDAVRPCALALVPAGGSRNISSLHAQHPDLFHLRGHADPDRPRLSVSLPARILFAALAMGDFGRYLV